MLGGLSGDFGPALHMSSLIQLSLDLVGSNGGTLQARVQGLSRVLHGTLQLTSWVSWNSKIS